MWFRPLSITLIVKRTRTSWTIAIRFISTNKEREGGRKLILLLRDNITVASRVSKRHPFRLSYYCEMIGEMNGLSHEPPIKNRV
jgi:hypothetical protein